MHNNIPAEPDPANGSDPQIDPYERFNELAMRLQKHGDSPWNLLDDQLMDNLIGTDQPEVDPDFADLANSLRNLQLFSTHLKNYSTTMSQSRNLKKLRF